MSDVSTVWGIVGLGLIAYTGYHFYHQYEENRTPTLAQQQTCSKAADKYIKERGEDPTRTYSSHFNSEYRHCFAEVQEYYGTLTSIVVFDALENAEYARYSMDYQDKADPALLDCRVRKPSTEFTRCKTLDEWEVLVKPLMGSGAL